MKKLLFVFVAVVSLTVAQAQSKFGVKAGANFANLSGDIEDVKMKIGFNIGVTGDIAFSDMFSFHPELVFSAQGAKYDVSDIDASLNFNYLNLPLLVRYNNPSGFYAELGPQVGFLMSAKEKVEDEDEDIKDSFKGIDFGAALGIGYQMKNGFGFGARYALGLSNILDTEDEESDVSVKNNVISVGIFYNFGGSK